MTEKTQIWGSYFRR